MDPAKDFNTFIFFNNDPDPYVVVTAHDKEGNRKTKSTRILNGTTSPRWNQDLEFGKGTWDYFTIQAFDEDPGSDDELSSLKTVHLGGPADHENPRPWFHDCYGPGDRGCTLTYKYNFIKA